MTIHERPPASATALRALIDAPTRAAIEAHVQDLIDFLDRLDGDPDLEPSLGSLCGTADASWHPSQEHWAEGSLSDLEGREDEDDEDGHDRENSDLAGDFVGGNLEEDDCDLERTGDEEPSLGWPETGDGFQGCCGSTTDLEVCDER